MSLDNVLIQRKEVIAYELKSDNIAPLHKMDTGEQALTMMSIYRVKHLPVVDGEKFLGLISEDEIMAKDLNVLIGSFELSNKQFYVKDKDHLFEVLGAIAEHKISVIPVLDTEGIFLGIINQEDLITFYANSFSFKEPGSILVLETKKINYSLAEISRIIESENGSILSSFLTSPEESDMVMVTIKISKQNINGIIAALERYSYVIKSSFVEEEYVDTLKERYDSLMSFLNV